MYGKQTYRQTNGMFNHCQYECLTHKQTKWCISFVHDMHMTTVI